MISNEQFKPTKQNKFIYFLSGFILPMFLIVYVLAEQPTIWEIAEQELDRGITLTESWTTESWETISKWTKLSSEWIKENRPSNNQNTQWGNSANVSCEEIVLHNELATEIARYMCKISPDADMLATFMQESWFNPRAKGSSWERWICQLMPNKTNNVWINDPRWNDWKRQSEKCIEKWKAVPSKWVIWMAYAVRAKYLHLFKS